MMNRYKLEIYPEGCCELCSEVIHNHIDCPVCKKKYAPTDAYMEISELLKPWCEDGDEFLMCEECEAMKKIWDSYVEAGIEPSEKVWAFFNDESPDSSGVIIDQEELGDAVNEWDDDCSSGFEVKIAKLPPNVKVIRFYNSW